MKIATGQQAPDFTLPDQSGNTHSLSSYAGKWVLLFFYPKDNTPGCTREACEFRDALPDFSKINAVVLGISADSPESHAKFSTKQNLNFTLLSDQEKEVVKLYDVWGPKKFMGREFLGVKRISFLIDPKGKIVKIYEKVKPAVHAAEVLQDLAELQK